MDLLTVVMQELGYLLGHDHDHDGEGIRSQVSFIGRSQKRMRPDPFICAFTSDILVLLSCTTRMTRQRGDQTMSFFLRTTRRAAARRLRFSARISLQRLELLETRTLLAAFTVTNTDDSGPGSLRQAVLAANGISAGGVVAFAILAVPDFYARRVGAVARRYADDIKAERARAAVRCYRRAVGR